MSFMNRKFVLTAVGCVALMFGSVQAKSADTRQVDVGLSKPLEIDTSKKLKIAFFIGATNNAGLKAMVVGAQRKAKELGIEMDVFDANWDPSAMVNQMENALQRDYNAWVVIAPDGNAVCDIATKEAPKKNILVFRSMLYQFAERMMARAWNFGVKGTVAFIGGTETPSVYWNLFEKAIADSPGEQRVGLLTGNALNPLVFNLTKVTEGSTPSTRISR